MTYTEKLRDPRWQKKRLEVMERDKWCCQSCRSNDRNLQVHHLFYAKKDPWDYPDEAYQTLCDLCHKERQILVDSGIERLRVLLGRVDTYLIPDVIESAICYAKELRSPEEVKAPLNKLPLTQSEGRSIFAAMRAALENDGGKK